MSKAKEESTALARPVTSILATQGSAALMELPAHLQEASGEGLDTVKKHLKPGRIKVIQSNRTEQFSQFKEGSVVITPMNQLLVENDEPFYFVPLLLFMEWCTVNPIQTKGNLPMIRARSLDPMSDIARKARDPDLRKKDPCPEKPDFRMKHVEYYVYLCVIVSNPQFSGIPVVLSFSSGEHKQGTTLANLLGMRRGPNGREMNIYANVFEGRVPKQKRHNESGDWYGINVSNPSSEGAPPPFVMDPDDYAKLKAKHHELAELHKASMIDVDHEDEEGDKTGGVPVGADGKEKF